MEGGAKASPTMCIGSGGPSSTFGVKGSSTDTTGIYPVINDWMNLWKVLAIQE